MTSITTSENVWDVAESKKATTKLEKVASKWDLEYIDMYNEWGALSCSRDFLKYLVDLSHMVTYKQGREILAECGEEQNKHKECKELGDIRCPVGDSEG
jgi:hypothetical protein